MIDTDKYEQAYEEWVLMEEPMGSFQTFLFVEYQKALTEIKRLQKILAKYMDIVQKYDDALLADGDTDPRWSELYD
jgi:hypothetical protein